VATSEVPKVPEVYDPGAATPGYVMAVIASVLVGRTERGDAMFMAMANRHAAQALDLDATELL
jgi:hypothetical protein